LTPHLRDAKRRLQELDAEAKMIAVRETRDQRVQAVKARKRCQTAALQISEN
jgi:hypothetical protein